MTFFVNLDTNIVIPIFVYFNKEMLAVIRFFTGASEFDLFLPQASLFLGMATEMNEFFALEQSRKSMLNRIERAKRGITGGKLPFGRTYNKQSGLWGIDKKK